jgi:hypothetical protein
MSVTMWLALVLEFASMALLRMFLGKTWLRRPGTLLVIISVVYDGVSQVLLSFPSVRQWDGYLRGLQPTYVAEAALVLAAGMLGFTVAYLLADPAQGETPPSAADAVTAATVLDWRLLALACAPLAIVTYQGRGYNDGGVLAGSSTPLSSDLAATFFIIMVVLAAAGFVLRHGTRWFIPVLVAQSLLLTAAGERIPVIADAVTLILLLARAGRRPSRAQLAASAALTVMAILAITGVRVVEGRGLYHNDSGLGKRTEALGSAFSATATSGTPGLVAQAAVRFDGTSFTGAVLQAEAYGQPRLRLAGIPQSLLLAVPSAAWPTKLDDAALNPGQEELDDFGLQQVNYLPCLGGMYAGFLSPAWLTVFMALLGMLAGRGERWLMRRCTPARLVLLAGAVSAVSCYEAALPAMLVAFRPAVPLAAAVSAVGMLRARRGAAARPATLALTAGAVRAALPYEGGLHGKRLSRCGRLLAGGRPRDWRSDYWLEGTARSRQR